jgi:hypothetical protein
MKLGKMLNLEFLVDFNYFLVEKNKRSFSGVFGKVMLVLFENYSHQNPAVGENTANKLVIFPPLVLPCKKIMADILPTSFDAAANIPMWRLVLLQKAKVKPGNTKGEVSLYH